MTTIGIVRDAEFLHAGVGLRGPIPDDLLAALDGQLRYTHRSRRSWDERRDRDTGADLGEFKFEVKKLYFTARPPEPARLVCGRGFADRVRRVAERMGYACEDHWVEYPQMRTGRFRMDWDRLARNFEFRPRQDEMVAAFAASEGGVIVVPTGVGKGYVAAAISLLYPDARIVLTTVSTDVAESDHAVLSGFLPDVGFVGKGKNHVARVTVYVTESLCRRAASVDCDILIGDEAHELGASRYVEGVSIAGRYARRLGLTASPEGRSDGSDIQLEAVFGPRIFEMTYPEAVELGLVIPIQVAWHAVVLPANPVASVRDSHVRMRDGLWRNQGRNGVVAAAARMHGEDDQTLVMVNRVEHAMHLGAMLPEYRLCFGGIEEDVQQVWELAGLVDSSRIAQSDRDRTALRKAFESGEEKKVIATGVWSRGVSFDRLAALVRADAGSGAIAGTQIPGRVSRRHEASGKKVGVLHDFRDLWDTGFKEGSRKRAAIYKGHGWSQVNVKGL